MSFFRIIVLAVVAYFAYRYYSWPGALGVVVVYVALIAVLSTINANRAREHTARLVGQKLSEAEKAHLAAHRDHHQAMHEHKAQFDPELRKPRE